MTPADRHSGCAICSQLRPYEQAIQHVHPEESDTDKLPDAVGQLVTVRELNRRSDLMQCPQCGTYYLYETAYEYLIGFGGSYDEQTLSRLSDERAAYYLQPQD